MLDAHYVVQHASDVIRRLLSRGHGSAEADVQRLIALERHRKATQTELDQAAATLNARSKEIGLWVQQGDQNKVDQARAMTQTLKEEVKELGQVLKTCESELQELQASLPNLPNERVPLGQQAADNVVVHQSQDISTMATGDPHWELASRYQLIDFEAGNKLTGAGFPVYTGQGARLQRALLNFCLDQAVQAGYREMQPPILVNADSAHGTGQLPDKEGQMYQVDPEGYYLIPTAEVPLTNLHRGDRLTKEQLPLRYTAYTPCFRREAGSWGSHVRGLNRLHQFDKVELVEIVDPEQSYQRLEAMRQHVEGLLTQLELPYRVLSLCSGDLGFTSAFTYDLEVWSAGQQRWLEVSSVSNFETYQARRMQLRGSGPDRGWLHTLNGSALPMPRVVAALLENHQREGYIQIPEALQAYTGFQRIELPA